MITVGASGMLAEIIRWMGIGFLYYIVYYIHLVAVWSLFAYTPYSKLAHIVYRTTALIHNRACGRELLAKVPVVCMTEGQETTSELEAQTAQVMLKHLWIASSCETQGAAGNK